MARSRWLEPPRASACPASSWATCRSTSRRRRLCGGWRNISCDQPCNRPSGVAKPPPQVVDAPDARPAAVALVLLEGPHGLEILLIRPAERADDPRSGQIALPG